MAVLGFTQKTLKTNATNKATKSNDDFYPFYPFTIMQPCHYVAEFVKIILNKQWMNKCFILIFKICLFVYAWSKNKTEIWLFTQKTS